MYITRDRAGYTKEFADYFINQKDAVLAFLEAAKNKMGEEVAAGDFVEKQNVSHNKASPDVALRLYGFNKWANENKMDAVIHVHFNDYPRPHTWTVGRYKGFAMYIPDEQFTNSDSSLALANDIFTELKKKYVTSTYVNELGGMVFDQKLIAIGANDTLDASVRSVLIEYGYIYRFGNKARRYEAYNTMASLTAQGIKNYFFKNNYLFPRIFNASLILTFVLASGVTFSMPHGLHFVNNPAT